MTKNMPGFLQKLAGCGTFLLFLQMVVLVTTASASQLYTEDSYKDSPRGGQWYAKSLSNVLERRAATTRALLQVSRTGYDPPYLQKIFFEIIRGTNAQSIANRNEANKRAKELRPILTELASLSANKAAAKLNRRGVATPHGGQWHSGL
jgi:hypothetical protein